MALTSVFLITLMTTTQGYSTSVIAELAGLEESLLDSKYEQVIYNDDLL